MKTAPGGSASLLAKFTAARSALGVRGSRLYYLLGAAGPRVSSSKQILLGPFVYSGDIVPYIGLGTALSSLRATPRTLVRNRHNSHGIVMTPSFKSSYDDADHDASTARAAARARSKCRGSAWPGGGRRSLSQWRVAPTRTAHAAAPQHTHKRSQHACAS